MNHPLALGMAGATTGLLLAGSLAWAMLGR